MTESSQKVDEVSPTNELMMVSAICEPVWYAKCAAWFDYG